MTRSRGDNINVNVQDPETLKKTEKTQRSKEANDIICKLLIFSASPSLRGNETNTFPCMN